MEAVFLKILNMGLTASWIILAVMILRLILKRAPKWIACLLWVLVAIKLLCPISIESALSLIPSSEPLPERILTDSTFQVDTGIGSVDTPINEYLGAHYYEGVSVPADNGNHIMYLSGIFWVTGIVVLMLYGFVSYRRLYRLTRASIRLEKNIFLCDTIDTPFILGIISPRICLPSGMEKEQIEYVIAHERAHLKRKDHIWKPAGFLLLCVYWFQPLCWLSYILLCRDIELACDEHVIRKLGQDVKKPYAEALLSCSIKRNMISACPLAFGEVGVKERVKNVLHYKKPAFWIILAAVVCCILAAVCFLTSPKKEEESISYTEDLLSAVREKEAAENRQSEETDQAWELARRPAIISNTLGRWKKAFGDRNGEELAKMMAPELREERFPERGDYEFGWSSPWPWDADTESHINIYDEKKAEIYYYAYTSDPHVTSWKETLQLGWENDICVITGEELICFDSISTGAEFEDAYHGYLDGTMMDYTQNGLGETLNNNALLSSSMVYRDLFEPESAAAFLLNLSDDSGDIQYTLHEPEGSGLIGLDITFLTDQKTYTISMYQPYGENGIWVPVDYRIDVVARFMSVPWEQVKNIRFSEGIPDTSGILCIGEIPEKRIKIYGYNDDEVGVKGVAVEMGNDVNYFDWFYTSPQTILPDLYWDEASRQLQISCHIYTGTGASADELHVLQQYDTGTLKESNFDLNAYGSLLEGRIGYSYDEKTRELVLTDTKTKEELATVTVPEEIGEKVTGLELGMISDFDLGEKIYFRVSPGYYMDNMFGIAEYEDMPELKFELVLRQNDFGKITFDLGEIVS